MKIILINTYAQGGAANAAMRLLEALRGVGIDAQMLCLNFENRERGIYSFRAYLRTNKSSIQFWWIYLLYYLHKLFFRAYLPTDLISLPFSSFRLEEHPLVQEADIIHLHWCSFFVDIPSFFENIKKPVVWTMHDEQVYNGGVPYVYSDSKTSWLSQRCKKIMKRYLSEQAMTVIGPSNWISRKAKESNFWTQAKYNTIAYNVDQKYLEVRKLSISKVQLKIRRLFFMVESVDDHRKGFDLLRDALQMLSLENVELVVVGKAMGVKINGIHIEYKGVVRDTEKLIRLYGSSDLFVLPSRLDNLPNTAIEAICCGTPVVAFDVGGLSDIIDHGVNGILVSSISPDALARGIQLALATRWDRELIMRFAQIRYSAELQALAHKELYEEMLKEGISREVDPLIS